MSWGVNMEKQSMFARCSILAVSSLGAFATWRLLKEPVPREDLAFLEAADSRVESFQADDGVTLRLKRYANEGAQPILMAHGFTGNGLEFDLPHPRHNLARFLYERGYDVWISNFRGCGMEPYACGAGGWEHSVDHLATLDAPALVEGVTKETGRKPIWIGHSMGGIVLYMYLQGARLEKADGGFRVTVDPDLASERNRSILGGITIGSPPGLHRGGGDWIAALERLPMYEKMTALLYGCLRWAGRVHPKIPVSAIRTVSRRLPRLGRLMAMRGPIAVALYNAKNVDPDVGYSLLKWSADNVTTRMAAQFLALANDPDLKDYNRECDYTAGMHRITAPIFFITGTEDFVGADNVREEGYGKVSSERKRFENYPGYGHTDLVMGKRVHEEVYPDILAWVEELAG